MADWTGLAGFAGLAAALENIQDRRLKEAQVQQKLTEGTGEWSPMVSGMGGGLGILDALFGYNKPGQLGIGSQRYEFKPYEPVTEEQARAWGLTYPEVTVKPGADTPSLNLAPQTPTSGFGRAAAGRAAQPGMQFTRADTTAAPFVAEPGLPRMGTEERPMPGIVGMRLGPKEKMALFQDLLKARREQAKFDREQEMFKSLGSSGTGTSGFGVGNALPGGTVIPPDMLPEGVTPPGGATPATQATTPATPAGTAAMAPPPGADKVSPQFMAKLQRVATSVGARPEDLLRVISFETGGSFSPSQKNLGQKSSAVGLIQFLAKTAKGLGTTSEALAQMTPEQQLDYVEKYLMPYKGRIGNLQDLYMAVLAPASIGASGNAPVFSKDKNPKEYEANAALDVDKKGFVTVADAVGAVMRKTAGGAAPAQTPASGQPDTSMMVAGPGAPAPKPGTTQTPGRQTATPQPAGATAATSPAPVAGSTATATTASAPVQTPAPSTTPTGDGPPVQAPFRLSMPGYQQILANNAKIAQNEKLMQELDTKQRQANYWAAQTKNTQLAGMATQIGNRIADLERANTNLREQSQKLQQDEMKEWRTTHEAATKAWQERQDKLAQEKRAPQQAADVKEKTQAVEISEELQGVQRDLIAEGRLPDKPWKDYSKAEQALVHKTKSERAQEAANIEKLDVWERTALFQIIKDEKTPQGRATADQLRRARVLGEQNRLQNAKDMEIAKQTGKMNAPMGETDALRYINPQTLQPASPLMTPAQAMKEGYVLLEQPQRNTVRNAYKSMSYVSRLHTLYFGGVDQDGSLTGKVGEKFEGIYPYLKRFTKENETLPERARNSLFLRTGILAGKPMAQWAQAADDFIAASLGQISREMGGERGHFTDRDAERARGFFAKLGTKWWGESVFNPNFMTSERVARDQLRLVTGVMSDGVRMSLGLKPDQAMPWTVFGNIMPEPATPAGTPTSSGQGTTTPPASGTTSGGTPTPTPAQTPAPAQEQAPAAQEQTPAPRKQATDQIRWGHVKQALEELFPGRTRESLSIAEKRRVSQRAAEIGAQEGY